MRGGGQRVVCAHLQSCEVDHGVNLWVFLENFIQALCVRDINVVEGWLLSTDKLDTIEDLLRRIVQVIYNNHIVASNQKLQSSEGTDISSSSAVVTHG